MTLLSGLTDEQLVEHLKRDVALDSLDERAAARDRETMSEPGFRVDVRDVQKLAGMGRGQLTRHLLELRDWIRRATDLDTGLYQLALDAQLAIPFGDAEGAAIDAANELHEEAQRLLAFKETER